MHLPEGLTRLFASDTALVAGLVRFAALAERMDGLETGFSFAPAETNNANWERPAVPAAPAPSVVARREAFDQAESTEPPANHFSLAARFERSDLVHSPRRLLIDDGQVGAEGGGANEELFLGRGMADERIGAVQRRRRRGTEFDQGPDFRSADEAFPLEKGTGDDRFARVGKTDLVGMQELLQTAANDANDARGEKARVSLELMLQTLERIERGQEMLRDVLTRELNNAGARFS